MPLCVPGDRAVSVEGEGNGHVPMFRAVSEANSDGLLEWASDKPGLHAEVMAYFASRKEDG